MEPMLVTGLPRSGTTFVGTVLSHPPHVYNIGEPFLHRVGAEHHYPYYRTETLGGEHHDALLRDIFQYRKLADYRIANFAFSLEGLRRYFLGSGRTLEYFQSWWSTQILGREGGLLVKEPHALMLTLPLIRNRDCKVVVLVRHPGGQVSSKLSLGWTQRRDRPESLLDQPKLVEDHLGWLPEVLDEKERSTVEDLGLMWRAQYEVLLDFLDEIGDSDHLRIVRHEDVCLNPLKEFSALYNWAGLPWTQEVETKIADLTSADNPTERSENTNPHQYRHRRDSSTVINVWKQRLTSEETHALRDVTEPTVSQFYAEDSWARENVR
jgi:hypothetical protein